MLKRLLQWLKRLIRRLFDRKQTVDPQSPDLRKSQATPELTDTEYESLFLQLLAKVNDGLTRGGVKGFLAAKGINEAKLVEWLRGFGERLLASTAGNEELAGRMVRLGELGVGELGDVAVDIGRKLRNRKGAKNAKEGEEGEAEAWLNQGNEQFIAGDFAGAYASFDKAVEIQPDYYQAWYNRGVVLGNLGRYEQAIASCDKAVEIQPDYHEAWYNRGVALGNLRRHEEAYASYDKALEIQPEFHQAWCNRGLALDNLGHHEQALASFDKALKIQPDLHQAWYNRGVALDNLGRHEQAITSYEKALEIQPDYHHTWYNRGVALGKLGHYEQAITSYEKALEIQPDDYPAWNNRGNALDNLGHHEQALASFDKAVEIQPDYHQAWFNRGNALSKLGRHEEAYASYDKAVEIQPDYHQAWCNRGNALDNLGHHEQALASFDKAVEIQPDFHSAWDGRGLALYYLGRHEEAIASYDKAVEIQPDFYQAWCNRGVAAGKSVSFNQFLASSSTIAKQNPQLNQRGYEGELASYEEGLKYCHQDTHPEGWGKLHQAIGNAHYFRGRRDSHPRGYWHKAVKSYNEALKTLTEDDFPELHLDVLQDLICVQSYLGETAKAEELQRRGTDLLRRLLDECKSPGKKKQLALKFAWLQQLTVDLAVQSGNLIQAIELAEQGKNTCLRWLLYDRSDDISSPSYSQMQQLLNPTTAIIYWHLSPYALHTFILKHDTPEPIILSTPQFSRGVGGDLRLRDFETWLEKWNQQYADYRQGKKGELVETWRDNLPEMLQSLGDILDINAVVSHVLDITQLILIPHRDLHRLPLHGLFPPEFTISYLPCVQIGLIPPTPLRKGGYELGELLSVEHPSSSGYSLLEFAQIESQAISRMFPNSTRQRSEEATQAAVINALLQGYNIFHFTGHGVYNFQNPALSFLALAGEDKLTLADIRNFDLSSYQLVSLAACETAITGNHTITTEYVGLVSGFMSCGVAHVVSTLWTVESEASALLMIQFYNLLQQGKTEALALAGATQWLRNVTYAQLAEWYTGEINKLPGDEVLVRRFLSRYLDNLKNSQQPSKQPYNHPYFWAAFTITGNFPPCNQ